MESSNNNWDAAQGGDPEDSDSSLTTLESDISEDEEEEYQQSDRDDNRFTLEDYQEKFRIMHHVLIESRNSSTDEWPRQFLREYADYLRPQAEARDLATEQKNFLYKVARDGPALPWLVSSLVENHPELLDQRDAAAQNALLLATASKQVSFIRSVLSSNIDKGSLSMALTASGENGNCIHQAIVNNLDPDVTIQLINAASEETLRTRDRKGLTPLHCAVDYARCTKSGLQVIKALIRCGNRAFDEVGNPPGMFSPYRYHLDTKRQYEKAQERKKKDKDKDSARTAKESKRTRESRHREKSGADAEGGSAKRGESRSRKEAESRGVPDRTSRLTGGDPSLNNRGKELQIEGVDDWERVGYNRHSRESGPRITVNEPGASARDRSGAADDFRAPMIKRVLTAGTRARQGNQPAITVDTRAAGAGAEGLAPSPVTAGPQSSRRTEKPSSSKTKKSSSRTKSSKSAGGEAPSSKIADEVAKELKLHYFRSVFWRSGNGTEPPQTETPGMMRAASPVRTHDSAIRFLYSDNKDDKQICFEFPPAGRDKPLKIDFEDFKLSYDAFSFDEVLLYVHFGLIELPPPRRPRKRAEGAGRRDMITFFNWLSKKGVTNIVKVVVEDRREVPHSDEAIVAALKEFSIELLDWRRVDIDPKAIQQACAKSTIRELHLWWSGNNAILRAWSEPDGILKLPHLERVFIHQVQGGLEPPDVVNENVAEFESRLLAGRASAAGATDGELGKGAEPKPIRVEHDRLGDSVGSRQKRQPGEKRAEARNSLDTHRWLSVVDTFAQGIRVLPPPPVSSSMPAPRSFEDCLAHKDMPAELKKEIRVALIDDGADLMHKPISNILEKKGRSFDMAYDDPDHSGAPRPFHGSTTGHGTCMAYMIGRVCPNVKIFVIKLDVLRDGPKASFTAKSAADAVQFAVERGFDIISMSWTIQKNMEHDKNNAADIARLEAALKAAVDKKKLVFCSAPDIGEASRELLSHYYPFGCAGMADSMFRIGAAKADGTMYGWTGRGDTVDFILPGHNVEVREEDRISEELDTPKTGSSVATALAAGLAALIIHCVRLGAVYNWCNDNADDPNAVNKDTLLAIKEWDTMKAAFQRISNNDKDCRVEVDNFFREAGAVLGKAYARDDAKIKWDKITQLARDLVSSQRQSSVAQAANGA